MKPQLTGTKKRPAGSKPSGAEAALCFQEELVAAIHGAFEVAVEIAVREVRKLVGQTAGDIYEDLRRENESLKQRLQRAEALLDSALTQGSPAPPPPPTDQVFNATNHEDQQTHPDCGQMSPNLKVGDVHSCPGVRGNSPSAGHQSKHVSRDEEQGPRSDVSAQCTSDAAPGKERNNAGTKEVTQDVSHAFEVKVESTNRLCQDPEALECDSPPLQFTFEQIKVKQEKPEEEQDGSSCCYDSIKVEDFSVECMSAVQSQMLEEWNPEVPHIQSQDPNTQLSAAGLNEVHPSNSTTSLPPPTDLPSLSPDFPSLFQLRDLAPISEAPPQIYGVHVRTGRNTSHVITTPYACKFCGQTFHLPSLLRRHYGQCQQRLQQRCQQPVAGSNRTRLQLYPPGCSPFRCTECNREFNRMENLKTHLRIHTGERPYTCSVCSKCFRHSGALTRHFRIHTGEKPYVCGQCGKSFRNCGGLKFHQRSHSKQLQ